MYGTFFGLKRRPFLFVPDVKSYFAVDFMEESRQTVERIIQNGEGISLIFGAAGTGKSLLLRLLSQSLEAKYTVILVSNSRLETPKALFLQLVHDLNLPSSSNETIELRLQILDFARMEPSRGIILLFDEAQYLSPSVLDEIRLLSDSVHDSVPLFHIVLAGTLEFEEKLTLPSLEAFNQRVASRCYLDSFSSEETSRYITRQGDDLRIASLPNGMSPDVDTSIPLFTETAKRRIHQLTDGIPRIINQLCGAALQFAAEKERSNVDEALVNDVWASLQHINPVVADQTEQPAVQEPAISPEQIAEIVDQKRKTFRIRQFDPIEFGTLADTEADPIRAPRSFQGNDYKPPYPEDDDADGAVFTESVSETEEETFPPCRTLQLHVLADTEEFHSEPATPSTGAVAILKQKKIPDFYKQERNFRRQCVLEKIQHRLGLFAGLLQKTKIQQFEHPQNESGMNSQSLQEYGSAVLDGRPLFVRKEPHYAYQTPEMSPQQEGTYPDPKTGAPITLRWFPEKTEDNERFGVSYTEFLNREKCPKPAASEPESEQPKSPPVSLSHKTTEVPIVRTSLNASLGNRVEPAHCSGLEETFEESQQVGGSAISLAELFRAQSSALRLIEESPEFKDLDKTIQHQLEAAVKRIIMAAEKIEQAAEMSERAGLHVSQAAELIEAEVKSALPSYTDLFKQWSEFQELISSELESLRQQNPEPPKFRTLPRRQVMIERVVPTIDVEALLQ